MNKKIIKIFPGVFEIERRIATKNLIKGNPVYGEIIKKIDNDEYRFWDPHRSKLCAAIKRGIKDIYIKEGDKVLYLGAATGTTSSHVADIIGPKGVAYCVEFAPISFRKLIHVCENRTNMIPIMGDARKPDMYTEVGEVDIVYEDVAQPDLAEILLTNCRYFLKKGGYAMLAVKSQSIDVTKDPKQTYEETIKKLEKELKIVETIILDPYEKDHLFIVAQKI
ncbi:MAG: fibrillarin-like rRNA/tRNA 2'-O-methyltransferase [Candidatus Micrarchaeia archaeon]|jgi:fibrillarin-like pre-rRNA processing protein